MHVSLVSAKFDKTGSVVNSIAIHKLVRVVGYGEGAAG